MNNTENTTTEKKETFEDFSCKFENVGQAVLATIIGLIIISIL